MLNCIHSSEKRSSVDKKHLDNLKMRNLAHILDVPVKTATFGMACFWAPDCLFGVTKGVIRTRVGFTGGATKKPSYRNLGDHTEAIQIEYDPTVISYDTLLVMFWNNHDPTANMKRQYTSIIFYHDEEQRIKAERYFEEKKVESIKTIVTEILPASQFYDAEDYHQKYRLQQHSWLCKSLGLRSGADFKTSHVAARLNGYVYGQSGMKQFDEEVEKLGLSDKEADYVRELIMKHKGQGLTC